MAEPNFLTAESSSESCFLGLFLGVVTEVLGVVGVVGLSENMLRTLRVGSGSILSQAGSLRDGVSLSRESRPRLLLKGSFLD